MVQTKRNIMYAAIAAIIAAALVLPFSAGTAFADSVVVQEGNVVTITSEEPLSPEDIEKENKERASQTSSQTLRQAAAAAVINSGSTTHVQEDAMPPAVVQDTKPEKKTGFMGSVLSGYIITVALYLMAVMLIAAFLHVVFSRDKKKKTE